MAGGDHLHFSMIVHNTFVSPLEWWDASWIKNNITGKLDSLGMLILIQCCALFVCRCYELPVQRWLRNLVRRKASA